MLLEQAVAAYQATLSVGTYLSDVTRAPSARVKLCWPSAVRPLQHDNPRIDVGSYHMSKNRLEPLGGGS
jgi:hypothetical protein